MKQSFLPFSNDYVSWSRLWRKKIIKIHSILEGKKKFFHALCIVKWQWRIVVGRYPMTAIKLHGCSRCTVAIVLRSALSFPHTPYLEQNNLGIFLNIKKKTRLNFILIGGFSCPITMVPVSNVQTLFKWSRGSTDFFSSSRYTFMH